MAIGVFVLDRNPTQRSQHWYWDWHHVPQFADRSTSWVYHFWLGLLCLDCTYSVNRILEVLGNSLGERLEVKDFQRIQGTWLILIIFHHTSFLGDSGIFFTLEMVLKISAKPSRFFNGIGWQMNIFDLTLVALQWLDVSWWQMVKFLVTFHGKRQVFFILRPRSWWQPWPQTPAPQILMSCGLSGPIPNDPNAKLLHSTWLMYLEILSCEIRKTPGVKASFCVIVSRSLTAGWCGWCALSGATRF